MPRRLLRLLARKMTTSIEACRQTAQLHAFQGRSRSVREYRNLSSATFLGETTPP